MTPWDARLALLATEAGVRPAHVYHCLHSIAADPATFDPQTYATFARMELRHVVAMVAALEAGGLMPNPKRRREVPASVKATRLPPVFQLPEEWFTFAQTERQWEAPAVEAEFQQFLDYWHGVPGQKGVKADWLATWRNWCRRSHTPQGSWQPAGTRRSQDPAELIAFFRGIGRDWEADEVARKHGLA